MKITCQSCHSKYNVADEKVQGKIVKIRCRKCGATIVVNGAGGASTNGSAVADTAQHSAVGAGDATQWHVNVGDNDQRTLLLPELVEAYNSGVVTQDTFIWCDGMDDWKPLAEVEVVVAALHASSSQLAVAPVAAESPAYEPPPAAEAEEPPAPAYEAPAAYAAPEPKRAAVAKREARARDLFATSAGEELHTSAPASPHGMVPAGDPSGPTGQRNENSVLFSLAVLTKNAEDRAPDDRGATNGEDSGLIDLKALASKAESMRPMAMPGDGIFHVPLGLSPPPVGSLLGSGPEAQPKSKLPLLIGGGAGVLVLLVLGIVIGVKIAGPGVTATPTAAATTIATVAPTATTTIEAPASAAPASEASASAGASGAGATAASARRQATAGPWHPPPAGAAVVKPAGGSGATAPATTPAPAPAPKKSGGDCGCNGDLMCLMKCSTH